MPKAVKKRATADLSCNAARHQQATNIEEEEDFEKYLQVLTI